MTILSKKRAHLIFRCGNSNTYFNIRQYIFGIQTVGCKLPLRMMLAMPVESTMAVGGFPSKGVPLPLSGWL